MYNTFEILNMKIKHTAEKISALLEEIASPSRLMILLSIGDGEACVCHIESILNKRQAYISQHLMALRQAGIITSRRDGRFIFYRLADPALLDLIRNAGRLAHVDIASPVPTVTCSCPNCSDSKPAFIPLPLKA
jgi:DNA-binding transcriptional ArsR family regulator